MTAPTITDYLRLIWLLAEGRRDAELQAICVTLAERERDLAEVAEALNEAASR